MPLTEKYSGHYLMIERGEKRYIGYMAKYPIINGKVSNNKWQRILADRECAKINRHG